MSLPAYLLPPRLPHSPSLVFPFHHTPPTAIYTLSLHDALPISPCGRAGRRRRPCCRRRGRAALPSRRAATSPPRSEEHTSELQSHVNLVCRLLLEKKKKLNKLYGLPLVPSEILRLTPLTSSSPP